MSYIDIRDFEADTPSRTTILIERKHTRIVFIYKTNSNKFLIYRQDFKFMSNDYILTELQSIDIVKQKTGFGYKKFFKCPYCGKRRQHLYFATDLKDTPVFACRDCIVSNVYKYRTNLYDGGNGECLIYYKVAKLLKELNAPIERGTMPRIFMCGLLSDIPKRPKYMREEKYALTIKRLHFIYWMWNECMCGKQKYNARDINDMLEKKNVEFVYEHMLFPEYYKEAFEILEDRGM